MVDTSVSFMSSLCMGIIEEQVLIPYPSMAPEQKETLHGVIDSIKQLLGPRSDDFRKWDRAGEMPSTFIEELKQFGLFGLVIPEEYGGLGFKSAAYARTLQEIAKHDASVAVTIGAHSSIGMRGLLLFGTDDQKQRYLAKLASGEMIAAFALTEAGAGSDAAALKTRAERDGDDWVLNGNKLWITNGGMADFFTVFARTGELEGKPHISAFIVTRDMPGVSVGPHEDKMGLRASSTTTVHFDNVRVPHANLLGEENKGFKVAMAILNNGRTGLGGGAIGGMKKLIELSTKYANERVTFGKPIREYGMIKLKVGQMVVDCYATEAVVDMVAALIDNGYQDYAVEAAISKVFASEALWRAADEALQVAGGNGYMCEYPYERMIRDARINRIFEGTNEINRLLIPGMIIRKALRNELPFFAAAKAVADELTALPSLAEPGAPQLLETEAKLVAGMKKAALAALGIAAQKHGEQLKDRQEILSDAADMIMEAYACESALLRARKQAARAGAEAACAMADMVTLYTHDAIARVAVWGRQVLAQCAEGDDLRVLSGGLRRLTRHEPVDRARLHDAIAARLIAAERYAV